MLIKRDKKYLRIWKHGLMFRRRPPMRKMNSYKYKGFKVTIWNNHIYSFRYEWSIEPLTQTAFVKSGMEKIIHDPTSSRTRDGRYGASYWAKVRINEIHAWSLRRYWQ